MDVNTAKPCKELKPLHLLMHPHLFFAICRVSGVDDSAAEPRKELRPLRVLCVLADSGTDLITHVARLQGLCGGLLQGRDAVCCYAPDNPFLSL